MSENHEKSITVRVPVRVDFAGGWTDVDDFAKVEGGAVLNAAINHYVEGNARWEKWKLHLSYTLHLPADSHLGTSGAIDIAWLALTYGLIGTEPSLKKLAEDGYQVEGLLGVKGGKQDLYAAALGGFHYLRFAGDHVPVEVETLPVSEDIAQALADQCILCYCNDQTSSGGLHTDVWERYQKGDATLTQALREIRDSVQPARDALLAGDFATLATQLTHNREAARRLHPNVVTPRMDELFTVGESAGALGSKGCGAGGGGCLLFICDEGQQESVANALKAHGGVILPFNFVPAPGIQRP